MHCMNDGGNGQGMAAILVANAEAARLQYRPKPLAPVVAPGAGKRGMASAVVSV